MLIWAPLIPATRWSRSQQSLLSAGGRLQLQLVSGKRGVHVSMIHALYRSASSPNVRSLGGCTNKLATAQYSAASCSQLIGKSCTGLLKATAFLLRPVVMNFDAFLIGSPTQAPTIRPNVTIIFVQRLQNYFNISSMILLLTIFRNIYFIFVITLRCR